MRSWLILGVVMILCCGFFGGSALATSPRATHTIAPATVYELLFMDLHKGKNLTWTWSIDKLSVDFWVEDPVGTSYNFTSAANQGTGQLTIPVTGNWKMSWENTQLVDPYVDNSVILTYTTNIVNHKPQASLTADKTTGIKPLTVTFTGAGLDTDGTIVSYSWDFGDTGTSVLQSPQHKFTTSGSFNTKLTVTDNDGASAVANITITPKDNKLPTASIKADKIEGIVPVTVIFTGNGTDVDGTIQSYGWVFGDGGTSTEKDPTYTFSTVGIYNVILTVKDDYNGAGIANITITVKVVPNKPPVAAITAGPSTGIVPLSVQFTGKGVDSDGYILKYNWDFGDGNTSTDQSPKHIYDKVGIYTVKLMVTDDDLATANATSTITVKANQLPKATIVTALTEGVRPLEVLFTGKGLDSDGTIASYSWEFGDGNTSVEQNPTHTYVKPSVYLVKLTVTDERGGKGSAWTNITVKELPADGDADGDGMPNGWEMQHKLDPLKNDSKLDPDKDGFSNFVEFKKKTDPQNINSYPITKGNMTVEVRNSKSLPMKGVTITVTGAKAGEAVTDETGKVVFKDYPLGAYAINITMKSYKPVVADANITETAPNPTVQITLAKKPVKPHNLLPGFESFVLVLAIVGAVALLGRRKAK